MSSSPTVAASRMSPEDEMSADIATAKHPASPSSVLVSRTPSAVEFPGAFNTRPKTQLPSLDRLGIVPRAMKTRVTEAVGGGLASMMNGMYNLVSAVNPLGTAADENEDAAAHDTNASSSDPSSQQPHADSNALPPGEQTGPQPIEHSSAQSSPGHDNASSTSPHSTLSRGTRSPTGQVMLQARSAGTSVAADLDEHCLADANADNPESNRPPTPTKQSFARRLRFPTADTESENNGRQGSSDPVSLNVSQRTGHKFLPGAEERRRYNKRMARAPQLLASSAEGVSEYAKAAASQRLASKARGVDPWRFITPRVKRVKRRALWRMFLAQELVPSVYDERPASCAAKGATLSNVPVSPGSAVPSPLLHPQAAASGPSAAPAAIGGSKTAIWAMEFSVCGRYLAAGGQDGVVRIWRILAFAREQAAKEEAHPPSQQQQQPQPQPQQQQPPNMARMRTASNHISTISDGAFPIPAYANSAPIRHSKHLRSFSMGQAPPATNTSALGAAVPNAAAGAANGAASLASNGAGAAGAAVDAAALHPLHAYELLEPVPFRSYVGHTADVLALSWSKNGFLLSASADRTVRLWHPHRPECLCTFRHRDIVTSVAFNPRDDRLFVSGSLDCRLRLWDIPARGVRHWTGLPDGQMVTAVSFVGSQGDRIVAGTYRGMCVFYETDGLAVLGRMHARSSRGRNAQGSKITGFAYSDTGPPQHGSVKKRQPLLLVSSNDSRLRMFLPEARTLERKYKGHANASSQAYARLSSDARFIISGSEDHNVYVWPVAQDNAATVATNPASDSLRIERVQRSLLGTLFRKNTAANGGRKRATSSASQQSNHQTKQSQQQQQQQQQSHESSASVADGDGDGNASGNASGNANQQQEWDSLDGRVEEKSIYEYFAAHDSPVSQALFAPSATLQYLAAHGDPILSRPKLRRTGRSGDVENLCSVSADGCFHGTPDGHLTDDTTVEDTTAIIVSADNNGNIRVFRKDINVLAEASGSTATSIAAPPEEEESDSDASTTDTRSFNGQPSRSGTGSIRTTSSRNFTPSALPQSPTTPAPARPQSQAQAQAQAQAHVQQPSPLTPRASPSFWNRLGRRVSQRRASQAGSTHGSSTVAAPPASDACQYCGHHKFVEFAVAPTQATGSSNGASGLPKVAPSLHVCENCKRVKNMPL